MLNYIPTEKFLAGTDSELSVKIAFINYFSIWDALQHINYVMTCNLQSYAEISS